MVLTDRNARPFRKRKLRSQDPKSEGCTARSEIAGSFLRQFLRALSPRFGQLGAWAPPEVLPAPGKDANWPFSYLHLTSFAANLC